MIAQKKYLNYPLRFQYNPYQWPPDLGLAELHSSCSEPGLKDLNGIQCPCCHNWSKKTISSWWCRNISYDLRNKGAAIPGYFHLLTFYIICVLMIIGIYSGYNIYAINYTCSLPYSQKYCIEGLFMTYLEYNRMIDILKIDGEAHILYVLSILQSTAFYILLFFNSFSVFFIALFNKSAKDEIKSNKFSNRSHLLAFHSVSKSVADNFDQIIGTMEEFKKPIKTIKKIELYEIKKYYEAFLKRNSLYYKILAQNTKFKRQKKLTKLNKELKEAHEIVLSEKEHLCVFSQKIIVVFQDLETKETVHKIFKISFYLRWYYGFRTFLKQLKILDFSQSQIKPCSFRILQGSDLFWQNMGETLGVRMASRIKAFIVCFIIIGVCYAILYYPMLYSLKADTVKQSTKLTLFEKLLPEIISLVLVLISIIFRVYLNKLSDERNPKDEVEKSKFILIVSTIFHTIFYVLMPLFFFIIPNEIQNPTIKLFVIAGQARVFMLVQLILNIVDLPYKLWKNKKISTLSQQSKVFQYNQEMLHRLVEFPEFPLQSRLDVMLRFWALSILYTFMMPSMLILIFFSMSIIYWLQKHNLYRHYALRRRVSIRLITLVLTYFVNIFSILLCAIYCLNVQNNQMKILCAVTVTTIGVMFNVIYWLILNKINHVHFAGDEDKRRETNGTALRETFNENSFSHQVQAPSNLYFENLHTFSDNFSSSYSQFLSKIQSEQLDSEVSSYLTFIDQSGQLLFDVQLQNPLEDSQTQEKTIIEDAQGQQN